MHVAHKLLAVLQSPATLLAAGFSVACGVAATTYWNTRKQPTEADLERQRRDRLAQDGRIVDGSITEARWFGDAPSARPHMLIYRYSIAGVTYECGQDVRALGELVRYVRTDLPVQVRFNPRNPGDSIVVAENWSGLRLRGLRERGELLRDSLGPQTLPEAAKDA